MNKLCFLLSLWFVFVQPLSAQDIYGYYRAAITDDIKAAVPMTDGFIMIGHHSREEKIGQTITRYHRPFVIRLDEQLKPIWEKQFPESKYKPIKSVLPVEDGFLVLGDNGYITNPGPIVASLSKLSLSGDIIWEKTYPYPGHYGSEGMNMIALDDGDLLVEIDVFKNGNSIEVPHIVRLSPHGEIRWDMPLTGSYYRYYPTKIKMVSGSKILLCGSAYPSENAFINSQSQGWTRIINVDKRGSTAVEKFYADYPSLQFSDAMETANDGWWLLGMASDSPLTAESFMTLHEISSDHTVLNQQRFDYPSSIHMRTFYWNSRLGQLWVAGQSLKPHSSPKTALFMLGPNWDGQETSIGDNGSFSALLPCENGYILAVEGSKLTLMR